jgi:hypothetical protein
MRPFALGVRTLALLAAVAAIGGPKPVRAADNADALFLRAKEAWRDRTEARYVQYGIRLRYEYGGRSTDTWYEATYRGLDGALSLSRIHLPGDERRLGGFAIGIFGATIFDTNPGAEVVSRLRDPAIAPAFTFGLMPHAFRPNVEPAAGDPTPEPEQSRLREIGRVIAVNREYRIDLAGVDHLRYGDAFHLVLTPLRDPALNRLRDLWITTDSHVTLQETVAGILDTEPYASATWTITYVPLGGRMYIQQIRTDDALRFGERHVSQVRLDFVDYRFPHDVPAFTFERLL